jgi:Ca-activated chloride channel family protein
LTEWLDFSRPWVLWALALLPLYAIARLRFQRGDRVPYAPLQHGRHGSRGRLARHLLVPVELLLLALVVIGMAGPYRRTELELIEDEGIDVALVLDVSLSMLAEDFPPNRLEALRGIAREFIQRSGSSRIGVVIFAKDAFVQTPLTTDHGVLLPLLDSVTVHTLDQKRSGGTAIGDALLATAEMLERSRIENRDQALILITDGESNSGVDTSLAARYVNQLGIRLYAIGIGGEEPVEVEFEGTELDYLAVLDDTQLRTIAEMADGVYYRASEVDALEAVFAELSRLESTPLEVRLVDIRRYLTDLFALAALPLFGLALYLGGVRLRRPLR